MTEDMLINVAWVMIAAMLVFFMQAGFAMLEVGFTRAKNAVNIVMKNIFDFAIGAIIYVLIGFGIMYGKDAGGFIGTSGFMNFYEVGEITVLPLTVFVFYNLMFCATSATIVSGAMAGRTKFIAYIVYSLSISAVIYPMVGHWAWGGGFLAEMGYHDFAGGSVVHMVGGICAFVGAYILKPRIGKYTKFGESNAIPGHSMPLGALGVFILWFGWYGFNCGSTYGVTETIGKIALNTTLSAAMAGVMAMVTTWIKYKKPEGSMSLNGVLAGLVSITASCDVVNFYEALLIGALAGIIVVLCIDFFDKTVKVDDPVGASSVHGVCGAFGILMAGIFGEGCNFWVQLIGVLAVIAFVFVVSYVVVSIIKHTVGLRVDERTEIDGLDLHEHGSIAYANFRLHDDR